MLKESCFFLAFVIQDRVEHCDFTGFSAHSGTFSTVPGISSPFVIFSDRSEHVHSLIIQKSAASCSIWAEYQWKVITAKVLKAIYSAFIALIGIYYNVIF